MLRDILLNQKSELENKLKDKYAEREVTLKGAESDLINVVTGPRRAGKSFFCMHWVAQSGSYGYVNFDDERLTDTTDFDEIVQTLMSVYENPRLLFFDEIQNITNWELIVNRLQREGYKLVITGSNSKLLSSELSTHLTGRHIATRILPFSFREVVSLSEKTMTDNEIRQKCPDYLTLGGYPEPWVKNISFRDYLQILFDSVLYKDIVKRHKIRFAGALENLATYLITNISSKFSYRSLARSTQVKSVHTVEKYVAYLEEAFLFFSISRFSFKVREQLTANKKIYCFDNGFYQAKAFKFSADLGKLLENMVAVELKRQETDKDLKLFYWKNAELEEVDFVVQRGLQTEILIQVCYAPDEKNTNNREIRALLKASRELKCNNLVIITNTYESEKSVSWHNLTGKIRYIPVWKWLLKPFV